MGLHGVGLVLKYWQYVLWQLWMVCMHMVVMYGSKMFACIVIGAVCFVVQGLNV